MKSNLNYNKSTQYCKGYKFQLYPTEEQKVLLEKFINANRYVYNWGLELELNQYEKYQEAFENGEELPGTFISSVDLMKMLTKHRQENEWLQEIPNTTLRSGIIDLNKAYTNYFKGKAKCPTFKSKKKEVNPHFHTRKERMYIDGNFLKIEGIPDYIDIGFDTGFIKSQRNIYICPVISKNNLENFYITFSILEDKPSNEIQFEQSNEVIGIDLNKYNYFALSNGKIYKSDTKKIEHLQRGKRYAQYKYSKDIERRKELERTNPDINIDEIPMSNRALKRKARYNKRCAKITNYFENEIHNITKEIIMTNPKGIVMEDLDVTDLISKHYIAKEIYDYSFGKCRMIMENKCNKYNIPFKLAPRNYASSQICSNCGYVKKQMKFISYKTFKCPNCGMILDRDVNAAKNLANLFNQL